MTASLQDRIGAIADLKGWRRNGAAFLFGVLATFTLAPYFLFPLLLPVFTGLYTLLEGAPNRRRMFLDGWWWGWGYYMSGLYWFCIALLTDAEKFAWLIPFALFGLTAVIALYNGFACWLMGFIRMRRLPRVMAFALVWTAVEFARGHLFTGFPWNLAGYSFGFSDASLQLASIFGVYGLTFFAVLLGCSPIWGEAGKKGAIAATVLWLIFGLGVSWGSMRLAAAPSDTVEGVTLRLVQANISQPHKWDPQRQLSGMKEHIRLMLSPGIDGVTHIIWPETAVPYLLKADSPLAKMIGATIPTGKFLITGSLRGEGDNMQNLELWNSMMMIDHEGKITGVYDKAHLVPFGEFQPLRPYVPKEWMTPVGDTDFSWGQPSQVLNWDHLPPLLPLICYEAIFPEMAQSEAERPDWLLNVTNDAWFGLSTGPHQHFHMARMRSVEQGVPLVRVANTGISAVIDGYGRIRASLPLGTQGILDAALPKPLPTATLFAQYHKIILLLLAVGGMIFIFLTRRRPTY